MSKHHPQVGATHVFNRNRHLTVIVKKSGEIRCVNAQLYTEEDLVGELNEWYIPPIFYLKVCSIKIS